MFIWMPLVLVTPLLFAMGYKDFCEMRIPNTLVLAACGLFVLTAPLLDWSEIGARLILAGIVFAIGFVAFALRLFGGGDVKMLSALMLFIPSSSALLYAYVFSASMLFGTFVIVLMRTVPYFQNGGWASMKAKGQLPMGVPIALSGIALPFVAYLFANP